MGGRYFSVLFCRPYHGGNDPCLHTQKTEQGEAADVFVFKMYTSVEFKVMSKALKSSQYHSHLKMLKRFCKQLNAWIATFDVFGWYCVWQRVFFFFFFFDRNLFTNNWQFFLTEAMRLKGRSQSIDLISAWTTIFFSFLFFLDDLNRGEWL